MVRRRRRSSSRSRTQGVDVRFEVTTFVAGHEHPHLNVTQCPPGIEILEERLLAVSKFRFLDTRHHQVFVELFIEKLRGWPTQFRSAFDPSGECHLSVTTASYPGAFGVIDGMQTARKSYRLRIPTSVMERMAREARRSARIDEKDANETVIYPPFDRLEGAQ